MLWLDNIGHFIKLCTSFLNKSNKRACLWKMHISIFFKLIDALCWFLMNLTTAPSISWIDFKDTLSLFRNNGIEIDLYIFKSFIFFSAPEIEPVKSWLLMSTWTIDFHFNSGQSPRTSVIKKPVKFCFSCASTFLLSSSSFFANNLPKKIHLFYKQINIKLITY